MKRRFELRIGFARQEITVETPKIQQVLREGHGIRVEAVTADYVSRKLREHPPAPVIVMGGDARTGVAVRKPIPQDVLKS